MTLLLAGDIGGTKTILRLVDAETDRTAEKAKLKNLYEARYDSPKFPDLVPMVRQFLTEAEAELGNSPQPERACFAIAGPVVNNTSSLTNLSWFLDAERLEQAMAIAQVVLINDFEAVGYGILGLELLLSVLELDWVKDSWFVKPMVITCFHQRGDIRTFRPDLNLSFSSSSTS
jgi:glucokinase